MRTITLKNDFHNTEYKLRLNDENTASVRQMSRALRNLCGIDGCLCGGIRGKQDYTDFELVTDGRTKFYFVR